jgi:hypothetical protein
MKLNWSCVSNGLLWPYPVLTDLILASLQSVTCSVYFYWALWTNSNLTVNYLQIIDPKICTCLILTFICNTKFDPHRHSKTAGATKLSLSPWLSVDGGGCLTGAGNRTTTSGRDARLRRFYFPVQSNCYGSCWVRSCHSTPMQQLQHLFHSKNTVGTIKFYE